MPFKNFRELIRFHLGVMAAIAGVTAALVVAMLEGGYSSPIDIFFDASNFWLLTLGLWIPFLLVCGAQAFNDYFDYEADCANDRQDRPLVRGDFSRNTALYVGGSMLITGVIFSLIATNDWGVFIVSLILAIVAVWYNQGIKGIPALKKTGIFGNFAVATGHTAPYVLGAVVMGLTRFDVQMTVLGMAIVTFFGALGRELVKGVMDQEGDKLTGVPTIAVRYGGKTAAKLALLCFGVTLLASPIPLFYSFHGNIIYIIGIVTLGYLLLRAGILLLRDPSLETGKIGRKLTKKALWAGAAAFLLAALTQSIFNQLALF